MSVPVNANFVVVRQQVAPPPHQLLRCVLAERDEQVARLVVVLVVAVDESLHVELTGWAVPVMAGEWLGS